jgi:hypothetical protein
MFRTKDNLFRLKCQLDWIEEGMFSSSVKLDVSIVKLSFNVIIVILF